ncbi:MAG TPA: Clp protease N-terminal domain-containing protein [Candidatus Acidoferrales bacterium]|nr:Clp protease N-terminal domain-containing protein [Candidatus Acidoferrales bacterium]
MNLSERIYRFLLRAYPRRYREQFAEPMARCFRDQLRAASGPAAAAGLWLRTLADLVSSVPARHFEARVRVHGHAWGAFSEPTRLSIFFARQEASSFSRPEITLEHLLLGILRNDPDLSARIGSQGVAEIVQAIETAEGVARRVPPAEDLRLSFAARRALGVARIFSTHDGADIEPRHLLRGILRERKSLAARLLRERGIR